MGLVWSSNAQALSLAPSYTCCEIWAASGSRPNVCEPEQTREYCEEKLNNPQADYTIECWGAQNQETCRAKVDTEIARKKAEVAENPIRLNPTFSEKPATFVQENLSSILVGILVVALGAGTALISRRK